PTLTADDRELQLLKEAAALPDAALPDAAQRGYELLDARAARELNPALGGPFAGALLCRRDTVVEPRLVPQAFRDHLLAGGTRQGPRRRGRPPRRRRSASGRL